MFHKLIAFILALLIGSPLCCCGLTAKVTEVKSCCHQAEQEEGKPAAPKKSKDDCPCAKATKLRELNSGKVPLPTAQLSPALLPEPQPPLTALTPGQASAHYLAEHCPPIRREPLYLRHCALLL